MITQVVDSLDGHVHNSLTKTNHSRYGTEPFPAAAETL